MKLRFFTAITTSKAKKLFITPTKEKLVNNDNPVAQFGSKEETFFDSQAWLESDCDDDFVSVNGDFTPARGSTSSQRNSFTEIPQLSQSHFLDRTLDLKTEPSPTSKKKRLSELLQQSLGGDEDFVGQDTVNGKQEEKSTNSVIFPTSATGTPFVSKTNSVRSSERTPNRYSKSEKGRSGGTTPCCLPNLVTSLGFSGRKG